MFQRPFLRGLFLKGLSTDAKFRFKIDWASLKVGSKFTAFALFYFVFVGNFPSAAPQGAYIWRGNLKEVFLCYEFGGGGAYINFRGAYTYEGAYFLNFLVLFQPD